MSRYSRRYGLYIPLMVALTSMPLEMASAAQCIWNKAGFVLKASWYNPDDIGTVQVTETVDGVRQIRHVAGVKEGKTPVQVDQWPTAQGRCTRGANANKELSVILSVVGGKVASDFVKNWWGTRR